MSVLGKILVKLGLDSSEFRRGAQDAERQTQSFTGKVGGMFSKLAGGLAIGVAIKKAFNFGKEAYAAAAQAEGVKIAFDRLNDPNLLNNLKSATRGTVDELKLMQLSVQAKNYKLPVEQLGTYLKFATKRAQETGMSVDYLTNSIITGLGRKSLLILDNLGISAVEIREEMAKGGQMADALGRIIQREMAKAGEITDTSAIKTERLSASWSNLVGTIGDTSTIKAAGNTIVDTLTYISDAINALIKSENLNGWQKFLGFLGHGGYQGDALVEESWKSWKDKNANERAQKWTDRIAEQAKGENDSAEFLMSWASLIRSGQGGGLYDEIGRLTSDEIKQVQELTAKKLESLAADTKSAAQQKIYREQSIAGIKEQIDELQKLADAETDPKKKTQYASQLKALNAKLEKEQALYDFSKKTFAADEAENAKKLNSLKSQEKQYGNSIKYQEELLSLMREKEKFAKSDDEFQKIKKENDELEKQIKLRKSDYQKNSETDLKNRLSEAETEMSKLDATTDSGKKRMLELLTAVKNLKWQIENLPQNLPTTEKGKIEKSISLLKQMQDEISIGDGSDEARAIAQTYFNELQKEINRLEGLKINLPKIEFADGSVASYQQQIAELKEGLDELAGKEREARLAKIALLEVKSTGAQGGFLTELDAAIMKLNAYKTALASATAEEKAYLEEMIKNQEGVVDGLKAKGEAMIDYSGIVSSYIQNTFSSIGDYLADLSDDGKAEAALERILIKPLADAAVALGSILIAMAIASETLRSLITNPYVTIAAGIALVALGTMAGAMAQGAINKSTSGGGASGSNNTFTGGYSNGGSYSNSGMSKAMSNSSFEKELNITIDGELRGDVIALSAKKYEYRKKR